MPLIAPITIVMSTPSSSPWRDLVYQMVEPNRREHPRFAAEDPIAIFLEPEWGTVPATVHGELVDKSAGGCRIRHQFGPLHPERKVWLSWADEYRAARVVWNCTYDDYAETGFRFGE